MLRLLRPVMLAVGLAACSADNTSAPPRQAPTSPTEAVATGNGPGWTIPRTDYAFTVAAGCGERGGFLGSYRVDVADGEVIEATPLDQFTEAIPPAEALSVGDLVSRARAAEREGAEEVSITASARGWPRRVAIDRRVDVTDDEECYTIRDVVTADEATPRNQESARPLRPTAAWDDDGGLTLTTEGSSSCPLAPVVVVARDERTLAVRLADYDRTQLCTADLARRTWQLRLPFRFDREAPHLTMVVVSDGRKPVVLPLGKAPPALQR